MTETFPTAEAWDFFMLHHHDIRTCCEHFLPVPAMQIPNTRVVIVLADGAEVETERRAEFPLPVRHALTDFDDAVSAKDSCRLVTIMNDAWVRAPEDRRVYSIPGFTPMCDLLDCTVDGFFDPNGPDGEAGL
jgi:hypothetical protein